MSRHDAARGTGSRLLSWVAAAGIGITAIAAPVLAQQVPPKKAAPPAGAPAAAAPAAPAAPQSAWVKLCEKITFKGVDKDKKEVQQEKSICLTHHERLDGQTGMVLISAAVRQIEGQPKNAMMVMVPLGMMLTPGLHVKILSKDLWEKASKNEKIDDSKLKGTKFVFTLCHPAGCTAEIEATPELLTEMKAGGGLVVYAVNAAGQVIAFPIPLVGFAAALDGTPVDNKMYSEARKQLMDEIRKRQIAAYEAQKAEAAKAAAAFKGAPGAPAPGAPAAAPAAPPKK
ncbi:MAG TPA: invasion associated locus B family protein [Hyphomicrobiaceae bacterium]|nr:invasion associated locus B family protein [Hyphomicrobiaceae bacterium]